MSERDEILEREENTAPEGAGDINDPASLENDAGYTAADPRERDEGERDEDGEAGGGGGDAPAVDYEARIEEELEALRRAFPEMRDARSIAELESPIRYAELRDLGLTPKEAYLATSGRKRAPNTRRHLFSAIPAGSGAPSAGMTRSELEAARELFPALGDSELMGLYKKVRA